MQTRVRARRCTVRARDGADGLRSRRSAGGHMLLPRSRNTEVGEEMRARGWAASALAAVALAWAGAGYLATKLTGQRALGARFGGRLGRWITDTATRLDIDRLGPRRIEYALVADVDSAVHLSVRRELLTPPALEAWLDEHVIARIPGASDAG